MILAQVVIFRWYRVETQPPTIIIIILSRKTETVQMMLISFHPSVTLDLMKFHALFGPSAMLSDAAVYSVSSFGRIERVLGMVWQVWR
jgi:hypothetical protein